MSGREDDIQAPPLSQDTPPQPWTPPPHFGTEQASRSGVTVDVNPPSYGSVAPGYERLPWANGRNAHRKHYGHGSPVLGPLLLIAAGVAFLLNNMGLLPWSIWGNLWRLWPLVLVALGLDMLFGRRNVVVSLVIVLLVLGAGAGLLYYTGGIGDARLVSLPLSIAMPASNVPTDVSIDLNDTNLTVSSLPSESRELAGGTLQYYDRQGEPVHALTGDDRTAVLRLDEQTPHDFFSSHFANGTHLWDVQLNRTLPLAISVSTGDANSTLDFTNLHLTRLDYHGGDGELTFNVPQEAGGLAGRLDIGDGNLNLIVPAAVGAHITVDKGDGKVSADAPFQKQGNVYTSNGTDSKNSLDLSIKMGDGNLNIKSR